MNDISAFELFLVEKHINILEQKAKGEIYSTDEAGLKQLLDSLFIHFFYIKDKYPFEEIYRITINKTILKTNKRIKDIRNLKYPPDKSYVTKLGRCNLVRQPVFYGSLMKMTSLNELQPKVGYLITESIWTPKIHQPLNFFPIFLNQPTNPPYINSETGEVIPRLTNTRTLEMEWAFTKLIKDYPTNLKKVYFSVMKFIADCFSKRIDTSNHWNYFYSAYLSDKIFNMIEDGKFDAIYYPSVPDKLNSENLAIKPDVFDKIYKLSKVEESIVIQDPSDGRGGYGMAGIAESSKFNYITNEILWGEQLHNLPEENYNYYKTNYGLDLT